MHATVVKQCHFLWLSLVLSFSFVNLYENTKGFLQAVAGGRLGNSDGRTTQQQPQQQFIKKEGAPPVGSLNGYDMYLVDGPPKTKVHCVGDTYQESSSWIYRSCEYENLCFDLDRRDFVIYEDTLSSSLPHGWYSSVIRQANSSTSGFEVNAIPRTTHQKATKKHREDGLFYPQMMPSDAEPPKSYYLLNVTMMPLFRHQFAFENPGHHLWQELLSFYTLIDMFDKENTDIFMVPLKQEINKKYFLHGDMMARWGSKLMGMPDFLKYNPYWEDGEMSIEIGGHNVSTNELTPRVICAQSAMVGLGQFSMHETHRQNGTHERRSKLDLPLTREIIPYYHGKGGFFRKFRQFMMRNIGVEDYPGGLKSRSYSTIFISQNSSRHRTRTTSFEMQLDYLRVAFPDRDQVRVESGTLSKMSLESQVQKMTETSIFLSIVGGGTASAIFLPKGSHLILFYETWFLDFDYWSNIPDIHVHWIPIEHLETPTHLPTLVNLIKSCLTTTGNE